MAKAGARYDVVTGNLWSYANRGDMTGVKAALARGVDVNLHNKGAGWTALHAAAAGGHVKVIRVLVRAGAELELQDHGGGRPVHAAARNGQVNALAVLSELGADLACVRLSQTKGKAARELVAEATRRAGKATEGEEGAPVVGYGRTQSKSNAFFGPRKTPISGRIKKEILQRRREARRERAHEPAEADDGEVVADTAGGDVESAAGHLQTVRAVKAQRQQNRRARARSKLNGEEAAEAPCASSTAGTKHVGTH